MRITNQVERGRVVGWNVIRDAEKLHENTTNVGRHICSRHWAFRDVHFVGRDCKSAPGVFLVGDGLDPNRVDLLERFPRRRGYRET